MYQSSSVFTSSIGYVGGPGSGTSMLVVGLLVLAEWRAPNGSVMAFFFFSYAECDESLPVTL